MKMVGWNLREVSHQEYGVSRKQVGDRFGRHIWKKVKKAQERKALSSWREMKQDPNRGEAYRAMGEGK